MNTKNLVKGVLNGGSAAAGLYAGKMIRSKVDLGLDPMVQDALHIVLGAAVIPMFAKGKSASYVETFGAILAGEALLNLVNQYLPAAYQISGTDNGGYALAGMYQGMAGTDNRNYALAGSGTFPERAASSIPATQRVAG